MNNVKTNRTMENAWANSSGTHWSSEKTFYLGWRSCLESVVQEPALTREQALIAYAEAHHQYRSEHPETEADLGFMSKRGAHLAGIDALLAAGRIPAPATVETPQEGELNSEWLYAIQPLERTNEEILLRHHQALSAREQAVSKQRDDEENERFVKYVKITDEVTALRAELAAEKLANEGKYALGESVEGLDHSTSDKWYNLVIAAVPARTNPIWCNPKLVRRSPTLTPAEKADAWVKWWRTSQDGEQLDEVYGWKELATRQANGETIDQIYAEVKP